MIAIGLALQRPLSRVPENSLKFAVGVLLSSFGTFWFGEGLGMKWIGDDVAILGLIAGYALIAFLAIMVCRRSQIRPASATRATQT